MRPSLFEKNGLNKVLMVDCSHAEFQQGLQDAAMVWQDVIISAWTGMKPIIGMMIASNLLRESGNTGPPSTLKYGISITDACISWETTEKMIRSAFGY